MPAWQNDAADRLRDAQRQPPDRTGAGANAQRAAARTAAGNTTVADSPKRSDT